jgi:hypothetical protein
MSNNWIDYVKMYAKENNIKYNEALKQAGKSYRELKQIKPTIKKKY